MQYPKEHYRELGYEGVGYVCPDLSTRDEYPDYIEHEVDRKCYEIFNSQGYDTLSFGVMADIHLADNENHRLRWRRTTNAYREISKRTGVDCLILAGDLTNEGKKDYKARCHRLLRAELSGLKYYPANGNHDDGTIWDRYYIEKESDWCNHLTQKERYNLLYNHVEALGAKFDENGKGLYYYFNDERSKVRFIVLDPCDVPLDVRDENGKLLFEGQHDYSYSQKQFDWVINRALKFDEEGWGIVFVTHVLPFEREWDTTRRRLHPMHELLVAYKNGESYKYKSDEKHVELDIDVDFSNRTRADIIATIVGHDHSDWVIKEDGLTYIETANCVMYKTNPLRVDGTAAELLFDIYTINRAERKIYITRIGCGENRVVEY